MKSAWSIVGKVAIGFGVVVLVSLGLCGVGMANGRGIDQSGAVTSAGFYGFLGGCAGLLLTGLAAIIVALTDSSRRMPPPPPPPTPPPPPPAG